MKQVFGVEMTEDRLIVRYGTFIYYDTLHNYEEENPGKYFDALSEKEKIELLEKQMSYDLGFV